MRNIYSLSRGIAIACNKTGATYYHAQLGLLVKGLPIKRLVVVELLNAYWPHQRVTPHLKDDGHVQGDVEGIISSPLHQLSILDVLK